MSVLVTTCPHCYAENTFFKSVGQYLHEDEQGMPQRFTVFFACNSCQKCISLEVDHHGGNSPHDWPTRIDDSHNYVILDVYPKPKPVECPDHVPDKIRKLYLQAIHGYRIGTSHPKDAGFDSAMMACRKALEMSIKSIDPEGKGNLKNRIDRLGSNHAIPPTLVEWAHTIRDIGNEATHEEGEPTEAEAKELLSFTEIFLMYTFTLPGMLEARRQAKNP